MLARLLLLLFKPLLKLVEMVEIVSPSEFCACAVVFEALAAICDLFPQLHTVHRVKVRERERKSERCKSMNEASVW